MTDSIDPELILKEKRKLNARNFSLGMLFLQSALTLYIFNSSGFSIVLVLIGINIFAALTSYALYLDNRSVLGTQIILGVQTLSVFGMTFILSGTALPSIFFLIIFTFAITNATMPPAKVNFSLKWISIIAVLGILQDAFNPFDISRAPSNTGALWIISGILIFIFAILILRQFPKYALRTKLVLGFVFLGVLIIAISFALATTNMRKVLTNQAQEKLLANAYVSAENVENFLKYSLDSVSTTSASLNLRSYLLLSPETRIHSLTEQQVQNLLFTIATSNSDILSYGILDLDGINILDTDARNVGKSEAQYDYFQRPLNANDKYISPVLYLADGQEGVLFFSVPVIYNDPNVVVGILRAKYRASVLQEIISNKKNIAGESSFSVLFDSNHIILAHGLDQSLIGKITYPPSPEEIKHLRENALLPAHFTDAESYHDFKEIEEGLTNFVTTPYFSSVTTERGKSYSGAVTQLKTVPWLVISAQPSDIFLAPLKKQIRNISLAAIAIVLLAIFSGIGLTNVIIKPIIHLENTAQEFLKGNLKAKASISTDDEIGSLATTFNNLSSQLGDTIELLEHRVEKRTHDLEVRTSYLEGAAEVNRAVASMLDPNTLINQIVELIKERFDIYYVGLFLVDKSNEWAVLKAGTGEAGQKMLKHEHKIKIGEGMIGWSIENKEARIALDVGEDAVRFENPDLPETRSEGALPLRSRGRVLGALTVQSVEESAFDESIITTLQTMADQVAVALDNAELFAKSEAALLAERKAYGQLSQQSWRDLTQNQAIPRFIVKENGEVNPVKNLDTSINLVQAIESGKLLEDDNLTAIIPIKNRDYILGGIKIRKSKGAEPWTQEELEITQAISEDLSVVLEGARLFDESQRKAQQEAILSDISTKIGSSIRMDTILQTTVKELGQALGSPNISFELFSPQEK